MRSVIRRSSHLKLQQMRSTAAFLSPLWSAMKRAGLTKACTKATCRVTSCDVDGVSVL